MKKKPTNFLTGLILILILINPSAYGQNVYLEVLDAETFQPLQDVKVEFVSPSYRNTFYTTPMGGISEEISPGDYTVTLSRRGYETRTLERLTVNAHEFNSFSFRLNQRLTADREEEETTDDRPKEIIRPSHQTAAFFDRVFLDLGYQFGSIEAFQIGIGIYVFQGIWAQASYGNSREEYIGEFYTDIGKAYELSFNSFSFGVGYDHYYPLGDRTGLFVSPALSMGIETTRNNGMISNDAISSMMAQVLKPAVNAGFYYFERGAVYVGLNYSAWVSPAMNQDRMPLENGITGRSAKWNKELFPGRKGFGFSTGIKLFF